MNDRLIKESDVLKAIDKRIKELSKHPEFVRKNGHIDVIGVKKYILAIPSADRPQGEWVRDRYWSRGVGMGEDYGFFYKCSLCEYEVENGYTRCDFNFCPYCGADMRNSSEKLNNCETCKYGEDKHRYTHICNECGVGINNYEPKDESFDKDINVHSKNEP